MRWSPKSTEIRKAIATLFRQTDFCRTGCSQSRRVFNSKTINYMLMQGENIITVCIFITSKAPSELKLKKGILINAHTCIHKFLLLITSICISSKSKHIVHLQWKFIRNFMRTLLLFRGLGGRGQFKRILLLLRVRALCVF